MGKYEKTHKTIEGVLYKQCEDCSEWFVADLDSFNVVNKNKDGLNNKCKTCQKIHNKEYYSKNKEKIKEHNRENYWKDPIADNKRSQARYHEKTDYYLNKSREYRSAPDCKWSEREAQWRRANKDKVRQYNQYREMHMKHKITEKEWESCKLYFNHNCAYCGLHIEDHYKIYLGELRWNDLHKEHVNHQGTNDLSNCIPSCHSCNSSKRKRNMEIWFRKKKFFTEERLDKIYKWLNEDYKLYVL